MLYIVGTPIGNLKDLSQRQVETIATADVVLAEDTRSYQKLVAQISTVWKTVIHPEQRVISYYKEREFEKLPEIIAELENEKSVVLLSEAGMPVVSDPGFLLIKTVVAKQIPVTVVPGPTAFVNAVLLSGFKFEQILYLGFLPKKEGELRNVLQKTLETKKIFPDALFVAYESSERINKTLEILNDVNPNTNVAICREMTKKFEEVIRGRPKELMGKTYKGEITIVMR